MKIEKIKLKNMTLDEGNAKLHPPKQIEQIMESIKRFGYCDPIGVWGENNLIVEGHGRYMALEKLGIEEAECIRLDFATDEERRAYALAHNATNMATGFDEELLLNILRDLEGKIDMSVFGLELTTDAVTETVIEDDYEIPDKIPPRVNKGEIWQLGRHRLICGDSTDARTVKALIGGGSVDLCLTDPPYNVDYTGKSKDALKIANDNMSDEKFRDFLTASFRIMAEILKPGGAFYVFLASTEHVNVENALNAAGLKVRQQLIWVKNSFILGRQDYHWQHEPCLYGWKDGAAHYFRNDRTQSTVQESDPPKNVRKMKKEELIKLCEELLANVMQEESTVIREDKPNANEEHPTMKPIRLMARLIANSTRKDEIVFDSFGGSGSTLMACEQIGRQCRTIELDERYASVIIDRWEKFTGRRAVKISDGI